MPKLATYDRPALARVLAAQDLVIGRNQALACGMSAEAVRYKLRPGGPWQVVLPGVYLTHGGRLNTSERVAAAFVYAGSAVAITGVVALARHGIPCALGEFVDVLVPLECRRTDLSFVRLHRTSIVPSVYSDGVIPYAAPARAIADAVRQLADLADVRALVAAGVQRGKVSIGQLEDELRAGPPQGSARLRQALAEVAAGARSVAEGDLRILIRKNQLPEPLLNPQLFVGSEFLASPDAFWPEAGVAAEVDSREWHLSPADWERTLARHARMTAHGILVLHYPPKRIRTEPAIVAREIRSALESARGPLPRIRVVPVAHTGDADARG
jgi:hypothetical protein